MECIEIEVQKETAEKWRKASHELREKITERIEIELTNALNHGLKEKSIPSRKKWEYLGSVALSGKADRLNIRDFAHDD